jgi:hypothetical protein
MIVALVLFVSAARAEHVRVTNPNAVSIEAGGRGIAYTIGYDRVMNDELVAGFGIGTLSAKNGQSVTVVPAYVNFYFAKEQGSLFATSGATYVADASSVQGSESRTGGVRLSSSAVVPTFGLGYENRGEMGFLFRVGAYALVADEVAPWAGFTFGYAF